MTNAILVSNRLPWTVAIVDGAGELHASSGGLATALAGTHAQGSTCWIGWPGDLSALDVDEKERILSSLREKRFVPLELEPQEVERYYEGFSNGVLWPLFHYLLDKVRLDADLDWEAYVSVNERFSIAIAETAEPDCCVWIHDYQLMLVPRLLRELRPDLQIGFFLHIPFPAEEVFRILPWRESILQGLLAADLVGFHTRSYREHFAVCATKMLGAEANPGGVIYQGRQVRLAEYAIGIDAEVFSKTASIPEVVTRAEKVRQEINSKHLLLGVDRLDYTKGIPRRLLAFERFLELYPERRDEVLLLQVAVPSREGVEAYAVFRRQVDEIAARINGRFGSPCRVPVHLLHQGLPFEELVALYCAADTILVTPLRDGMNLVAKEFCAARNDESGVLVLSEFAGAAAELKESLLVNPYDIGAVATAIERSLCLSLQEKRQRMRALRRRIFKDNVHRWAADFMSDLRGVKPVQELSAIAALLQSVLEEASRVARIVLLLDYDGTLVPFAESPDQAAPDGELIEMLSRLAAHPRLNVEIVSGRSREDLETWFGSLPVVLHAEHGFWRKAVLGETWSTSWSRPSDWMAEVRELLEAWNERFPGALIEEKSSSLAWHHRQVANGVSGRQLKALRKEAAPFLDRHNLELLDGAKVLEFRMVGVQKGLALSPDMASEGSLVVAIGDDLTDEDLFKALPPSGISIRVGQGPSRATYRLPTPQSVRLLLSELCETLSTSPTA